jgi:hypothetical protein
VASEGASGSLPGLREASGAPRRFGRDSSETADRDGALVGLPRLSSAVGPALETDVEEILGEAFCGGHPGVTFVSTEAVNHVEAGSDGGDPRGA